ncbi:MAG TPA: transporter [Sutterella sp.]|nr:transporter [Sutterella sp.]
MPQPTAAQSLDLAAQLSGLTSQAISDIQASFSTQTALWELAAIVFVGFLSLSIYRMLRKWIYRHLPPAKSPGFSVKMKRWCLLFIKSTAFSVSGSLLLWLATQFLRITSLVDTHASGLLLVRTANQIFFAWAILQIMLILLTDAFGPKLFAPIVRKSVSIVFWICAALQIAGILPGIVTWMGGTSLPIGSTQVSLWSVLTGSCTVLVTLGAANVLSHLCETAVKSSSLDSNFQVVSVRILRIIFFSLAVLLALSWSGIDLTVLSVFSGAIGVGIGFGMQKIAANYISGFIILFDRSVKLGDYIQISGFSGIITQINTRYSVIRNLTGEEMIIPNEMFITSSVKNLTLTDKASAQSVIVSIAYDADIGKALEIALAAVKSQPRVLTTPAPWAIVSDLGDSGIDIKAGFFIQDPENGTGSLKSNIIREILRGYGEAGIEIPYNKLDVSIISSPKP